MSEELLTPEMFGAKGDGASDDTEAFAALSAYLNSHDGGTVSFRSGATYVAGRQRRGTRNYLAGEPILHASNVSALVIRMNGATIKFKDGMKFGTFDPRSGTVKKVKLPFTIASERADIGYAIMAKNVGFFSVSSGLIDCNSQGAIIGGEWGDAGRQCIQYGIAAYNCDRVEWSDLQISNSCLDGLLYAYAGLRGSDRTRPLLVRRVTVDRAGRNCVSVTGTNSASFENCTFQRAGEAPNRRLGTNIQSAPASCFDLEAEGAECKNLAIRHSKLISGAGSLTAFVADSGTSSDILIEDCSLEGVVWTSKPRTTFRRCQVSGVFGKLSGGHGRSQDNSQILDSHISDRRGHFQRGTISHHAIDLEGAGRGVYFRGTTIDVASSRLNLRGGILDNVTINFWTGTDKIGNRDYAILADGARLTDVTIHDRIPAANQPREAFYVTAPAVATNSSIMSARSKILWNSWSPGARGYTGRFRRP